MFKFDKEVFLSYPLLTSLFVVDLGLLLFLPLIRPPLLVGMALVGGLVYLSMFFGVKLQVK
jgi:hypothetical protein